MVAVGTSLFTGSARDSHASSTPPGLARMGDGLRTQLSQAESDSATTLNVLDNTNFHTAGLLSIGTPTRFEVVSYTGKNGTTQFTGVTRGLGLTDGLTHVAGAAVAQVPSAINFNDLAACIEQIEKRVMVPIAEAAGTGASGVIEFTGIPATYRHLQVTYIGRSSNASLAAAVNLTFEASPTAGAYNNQFVRGNGSMASAAENAGAADVIQAGSVTAANGSANAAGWGWINILDYSQTNLFKAIVAQGLTVTTLGASGLFADAFGGVWESTAAIDRIRLTLSGGNWSTSSRVTLYGIPGQV